MRVSSRFIAFSFNSAKIDLLFYFHINIYFPHFQYPILGPSPAGHVADRSPKKQHSEFKEVQMSRDSINIDQLGRFSALFPDRPWRETTAQKQHVDVFGVVIKSGEIYYRQRGGKRHKLSRLSMERLIHIFLDSNQPLLELAEKLCQREIDRQRQIHAKYSPVSKLERLDLS
jgi:hypothetical protein